MVVRANRVDHSIGGHISTYASAATLFEVGFNHFFRGRTDEFEGDTVYLQGHASPGVYSRAFLEGRLSAKKLENFRRELREGGGLSSYPHPWLMPDFWEFPTVSMGLSPLMAIYQARFNRYLEDRGLKPRHRRESLGVPGRRRDRRAGNSGRNHAGFARKSRQPDLRHQLQPAAPGRPGSRQRKNRSGTGSRLPRRRLELYQGSVGKRLGSPFRTRHRRPAGQAPGRNGGRRIAEAQRRIRRLRSRARVRRRSPPSENGRGSSRTRRCARCARAGTIRAKFTPPTRLRSNTRALPP